MFVGTPGAYALRGMLGQQGLAYYSGDAIAARARALVAGTPHGGSQSGPRRLTDDEFRASVRARLQKIEDDNLRRRIRKCLAKHRRHEFAKAKAAHDRKLPAHFFPKDVVRGTAHHEAGHAFACVLYDAEFEYVTITAGINEDGISAGRVAWTSSTVSDEVDRLVVLAGPIAEARFHNQRWKPGMCGDESDVKYLKSRGLFQTGGFAAAVAKVEGTVETHWEIVCDLAELLVEHRTILFDDVQEFVEERLKARNEAA